MTYPPDITWLELADGRCLPVHLEPRRLSILLRAPDGAPVAGVPDSGRVLAYRRGLGPVAARKDPDGSLVLLEIDDLCAADRALLALLEEQAPHLWPRDAA